MNVEQLLRDHPFCRGLGQAQVEQLARIGRLAPFPAGAFIFREGGAADCLYLIASGRVVLEQHVPGKGDVQLESLTAGELLGLSWLFAGARWVLDARAATEVVTVALGASELHARMDAEPSLGLALTKHVVQQLYQRLERVRLQRLDVYKGAP